jgi:hypothetical protein
MSLLSNPEKAGIVTGFRSQVSGLQVSGLQVSGLQVAGRKVGSKKVIAGILDCQTVSSEGIGVQMEGRVTKSAEGAFYTSLAQSARTGYVQKAEGLKARSINL